MKSLALLSLLYFGITALAQNNYGSLDINQVNAGINSNGNLHYTPTGFNPAYEVPKGSGKHSGSFTNLWFGGMYNSQLHLAAQLAPFSGADFNWGPLAVTNALATNSAKYTKIWKLNKSDINAFIANYASGNVQNGSYVPVPDLLSWPGNGDISKNEDLMLAPYVDMNNSNTYDPLTGGDYPLIKGDQALYFIYNDATTSPHTSGGQTLGLEIRCMAYAYGTCSVVAANPALDYTTFYEYTIINRSTRTYSNFNIGLYSEADLGQYADDYIGCDVKDNYGYIYNGDTNDETAGGAMGYGTNPPAAAFVMLRSPDGSADGLDNNYDGLTDEAGEQMGMTNFSYFFTPIPGVPSEIQQPSSASEHYNYMRSIWRDNTPFSCNTVTGYGGPNATPYLFPGTTYTNAACSGSWSETGAPNDRRYIMSTRDDSFQPGEIIRLEYAHVTSFPGALNALTQLDQDVNAIKTFYQSGAGNSYLATSLYEQRDAPVFSIYPNPASSSLTLSFDKILATSATIAICDIYGKTLLNVKPEGNEATSIDISTLASGIYFIKVSADGKSSIKKFIKS